MFESKMIVGKYEILDRLGEGAFATVFKARNIETKEIVAVKRMKKMTKNDAEMVRKQINIMKELKHKNIVRYIQDFRENGEWIIVLEYCGKGDMEHFKQKVGKIPQHHCKMFVEGILEALVELHKKKIAHRDLKLANILITDDYRLKLADFGFSKDYQSGYMKTFCGSPITMAPQVLKRENYNQKCDVWSLGVITYMMLYKIPPFLPTKAEGMGIQGITLAVTTRPHKFNNDVPVSDAGKKFINDCLKKNVKDRPTTAELLNHEWFEGINIQNLSKVRMQAIKGSFQQDPNMIQQQGAHLCEIMIYGVFEEHLKKIGQSMLLNTEVIQRTKATFQKYYRDRTMLQYYFMIIIKKLSTLQQKNVIYMLYDQSFRIKLKDIEKFKDFNKESFAFIQKEMPDLHPGQLEKVDFQKEIIKFCTSEAELLMENSNDDEINQKLFLLKSWVKFAITEYEDTKIEISWGGRKDLEKYQNIVTKYLQDIKEESIIRILQQQPQSDEDLQATWLIENHIKESNKNRKSLNVQLGKLALYILNIPSNFTVDKTLQSQQIMLTEQHYWNDQINL